jgi:hypothetical protein
MAQLTSRPDNRCRGRVLPSARGGAGRVVVIRWRIRERGAHGGPALAKCHFMRRRIVLAALMLMSSVVQVGGTVVSALSVQALGAADPTARSTGHDAEWLGHAWVDGRKNQSDVDMLARQLRDTGIRDLFVHAGPFNNDGTLDPALRPRARWLTGRRRPPMPGTCGERPSGRWRSCRQRLGC